MKLSWLIILFLILFSIPFLISRPKTKLPVPTLPTSLDLELTPQIFETFSLIFAGDVMLGRSVNTRMIKYADTSWPFQKIAPFLSAADLTLVNLESPFHSNCPPTDQGMIFCANPFSVAGLQTAGIDVVNLANNHINNQGQEGIDETNRLLSEASIATIGQNKPHLVVIKNTRLAFLGFTDINAGSPNIATATPENIRSQISKAKTVSDLVITTFHWGLEYGPRTSRQVELAHLAIDSGSDAVIGHHPHWVQEVEQYQGKPIYYSLGNLVFDQMWSEQTRKGLIIKLTYSGQKLLRQERFPIKIFDYGSPAVVGQPAETPN